MNLVETGPHPWGRRSIGLLALALLLGCGRQHEGGRCDLANRDNNGVSLDCEDGLACREEVLRTPPGSAKTSGICCSPNSTEANCVEANISRQTDSGTSDGVPASTLPDADALASDADLADASSDASDDTTTVDATVVDTSVDASPVDSAELDGSLPSDAQDGGDAESTGG